MNGPLVLVLYNQPLLPADHPDAESEHTIVDIALHMGEILREDGYRISMLGLRPDPAILWNELRRHKPDVVFNLFEGNLSNTETESYVTGLLEWSGIPHTGSPLRTLTLARAKHLTKQLLRGAGLPTADFFVVQELPVPTCELTWPVIVKPATQDASVGLDQDSVVTNQYQLEQRVAYILETYGAPVLVEEYIEGREFNVAVTEIPEFMSLPPSEIRFDQVRPGAWHILTYAGKWCPGTDAYDLTPPDYPAKISSRLAERLGELARRAYRLLGCRDYARVDFRARPSGKPYILEVNPNPEISATAGFAGCLGSANIRHQDFIKQLIQHALLRRQAQPTWAMHGKGSVPSSPCLQ
jgi:D-alanine-D-alanine ligase